MKKVGYKMDNIIMCIRKNSSNSHSTESIYEVLLDNGDIISIPTLLELLSLGLTFYYFDHNVNLSPVQGCYPLYKESYIESHDRYNNTDELLLLPSF